MDNTFKKLICRFMIVMLNYVLYKGVGVKLYHIVQDLIKDINAYDN